MIQESNNRNRNYKDAAEVTQLLRRWLRTEQIQSTKFSSNRLAEQFEVVEKNQKAIVIKSAEEICEQFCKVFHDVLMSHQDLLLENQEVTNISLGFNFMPSYSLVLIILVSKKIASTIAVANSTCPSRGLARILIGQQFDPNYQPYLVIINQGLRSELKLGPSNIVYNPSSQSREFKIWYFENEIPSIQKMRLSPFNDPQVVQTEISVDIYFTWAQDNVAYGQCSPINQNFDPSHLIHGYSDRVPASQKNISLLPNQALQEDSLSKTIFSSAPLPKLNTIRNLSIQQRLEQRKVQTSLTNQIGSAITNVGQSLGLSTQQSRVGTVEIKKTRAQILKEEQARRQREGQVVNGPVIALGPSEQMQKKNNFSFGFTPFSNSLATPNSNQASVPKQQFNQPQLNFNFTPMTTQQPQPIQFKQTQQQMQYQQPIQLPIQKPTFTFQRSFTTPLPQNPPQYIPQPMHQYTPQMEQPNPPNTFVFQPAQQIQISQTHLQSSNPSSNYQIPIQQPQILHDNSLQNQTMVSRVSEFQKKQGEFISKCSKFQLDILKSLEPYLGQNDQERLDQAQVILPSLQEFETVYNKQEQCSLIEKQKLELLLSWLHQDPKLFLDKIKLSLSQLSVIKTQESITHQNRPNYQNSEEQFIRNVLAISDMGLFLVKFKDNLKQVQRINQFIEQGYQMWLKRSTNNIVESEFGSILVDKIYNKVFISETPAKNESMMSLYEQHRKASSSNDYNTMLDLCLKLKGQVYHCHQFIIRNSCDIIDKNCSQYEQEMARKKLSKSKIEHRIELPDWMSAKATRIFIRFLYIQTLSDPNYSQPDELAGFDDIFDLFKIAKYFNHKVLLENLVVDGLLPIMSLKDAIGCLQLQQTDKKHQNPQDVVILLEDYCCFKIAKEFPEVLMLHRNKVSELNDHFLKFIMQRTFLFLQGEDSGQGDIQKSLQFFAHIFSNGNIFNLFEMVTKKFYSCSAFHFQIVPRMKQLLSEINPDQIYLCNLIKSAVPTHSLHSTAHHPILKSILQMDRQDLTVSYLKQSDITVFLERPNQVESTQKAKIDGTNWDPQRNKIYSQFSKGKDPVIEMSIRVGQFKEWSKQHQEEGCTCMSKAFSGVRRSWHLKIDFDKQQNLSLYVVERGRPMPGSNRRCDNCLVPDFSSTIIEICVDVVRGGQQIRKKEIPIFYSFGHNTHQIIGVSQILSLEEYRDCEIQIRIFMKDLPTHSSIMTCFSNNFQKLFERSLSLTQQSRSLFSLQFPFIFHLLMSNSLSIQDENKTLSFLHHYLLSLKSSHQSDSIEKISDLLSHGLRYNYICISKMLKNIARNQYLAESVAFKDRLGREIVSRTKIAMKDQDQKQVKSEEEEVIDIFRQQYDRQAVGKQGRNKIYSSLANCSTLQQKQSQFLGILTECIEFGLQLNNKKIRRPRDNSSEETKVREFADYNYEQRGRVNNSRLRNLYDIAADQNQHLISQKNYQIQQLMAEVATLKCNSQMSKQPYGVRNDQNPNQRELPAFIKEQVREKRLKNQDDSVAELTGLVKDLNKLKDKPDSRNRLSLNLSSSSLNPFLSLNKQPDSSRFINQYQSRKSLSQDQKKEDKKRTDSLIDYKPRTLIPITANQQAIREKEGLMGMIRGIFNQ